MTTERADLLVLGSIVLWSALLAALNSLNWLLLTEILWAHLVLSCFSATCLAVMTPKKPGLTKGAGFA